MLWRPFVLQTVSKWEVGESTPDMEKLIAISELFDISLDELIKDKVDDQKDMPNQIVKSSFYSDIKNYVTKDEENCYE